MIATIANESLQGWIDENQLKANFINDKIIEVGGVGKFLLVEPKNLRYPDGVLSDVIFDPEFQINLSDEENELVDQVDYLLFKFGNRWYYVNDLVPEEIKELKYLGLANLTFSDVKFPHLGIHGQFELCNGSRLYKDWIKKAKFLNTDTLGICEENTLAGTLEFQEECKKAEIKPVIGETITILTSTKGKMHIKLFVENDEGWKNLLWINKVINVDNDGSYITLDQLLQCSFTGLVIVLTPEVDLEKYLGVFTSHTKVFYQLDFVEWSSNSKDEQWLKALKNYIDNYINHVEPILICDSYYLDKEDWAIKKTLNSIGKLGFKNNSKDQYFKSIDEVYLQCSQLFKEDDERWNLILDLALENLNKVCVDLNFKIPTSFFRLPEYEMNEAEKGMGYVSNEDLFFDLIDKGINQKVIGHVKNEAIYLDRVEEEIEVIKKGGFIDYFLILWDILNFCKENKIWYGVGRGSAAGSLVSYLLGIVGIDPLEYGLIFSRFLNAGRIGKSLPDIDLDFQGERRDEVKRYIETKYGVDYVAAIGTYTTLKIKAALKDLSRERGVDYSKTNFVASLIDDAKINFTGLFKLAAQKEDVKKYVQKNHKVIENLPLVLNQPKTSSVHASGVIIVSKKHGSIYEQMPVKKIDGVLVSEWEGEWIDKAGFLKCDILGIKQLDKIAAIANLVEQNTGEKIDFDLIKEDLDNPDVISLFQDGFTEDVFQFGTAGLKSYCKEMKPDNLNDLIAAVALYRPGTMDTGMHKKYIKIKHGIEKPMWDDGTKNATQETFGIAVYQEQVMQICVDVAGFNSVEADDIRKAMGKKDAELLEEYKEKFIQGAINNRFTKEYAVDLWEKLKTFAGYGFNKSHAACYAITGYFCQWLKYFFPVEFWTVSLQYAKDEEIINRISEISKISNISVASVDINKSTTSFYADNTTSTVFWALNNVKWVGEKAVYEIIAEREENGAFYSIEDFCDRIKRRKEASEERSGINKRTITNLILAGAFDKTEKIQPEERGAVIKRYYAFANQKLSEDLLLTEKFKPYQWVLKQKELTGFGFINYSNLVAASKVFASKHKMFRENGEVLYADIEDIEGEQVVIAGILQNCYDKPFKGTGNRGLGANLEIIDNSDVVRVTIWMDVWETIAEKVLGNTGKIIIISGKVVFDSYRNMNCIQSNNKTLVEVI